MGNGFFKVLLGGGGATLWLGLLTWPYYKPGGSFVGKFQGEKGQCFVLDSFTMCSAVILFAH